MLYPEVKELLDWAGIEIRSTSSNHPQGDGQVERHNREVRQEWARLGDDDEWDANLAATAWYRNTRPSRRADVSAFQIMFGVEPRLPLVERLLPAVEARTQEIGEAWTDAIKRAARERHAGLLKFKERMREYEAGRRRKDWSVGDLVLVRNFGRKKGEPRWKGPYTLLTVTARAATMRTDAGRQLVVNKSDIKPYRQPPRAADVVQGDSVSADNGGAIHAVGAAIASGNIAQAELGTEEVVNAEESMPRGEADMLGTEEST